MTSAHIFFLVMIAFSVDALVWKNCDGRSPAVRIVEMNLSPHPLTVRPGAKVTFSGKFTVDKAVGTSYKIKFELWKKLWFGWYKIPCSEDIKCNQYHDIGCHQLVGFLGGTQCPLPQGTYLIRPQTHVLPDFSIPSLLLNGRYKIQTEVIDERNYSLISCVEVEVEIRS